MWIVLPRSTLNSEELPDGAPERSEKAGDRLHDGEALVLSADVSHLLGEEIVLTGTGDGDDAPPRGEKAGAVLHLVLRPAARLVVPAGEGAVGAAIAPLPGAVLVCTGQADPELGRGGRVGGQACRRCYEEKNIIISYFCTTFIVLYDRHSISNVPYFFPSCL